MGYYMMFEADNNRIGITPNNLSNKPYLVDYEKPTLLLPIDDFGRNWPTILLLLVASAGFLVVWFFCVFGKLITGLIAKIVATSVYCLILLIGEWYLYRWMVRKNVFGGSVHDSDESKVVLTITMVAYGLVTTILYNAVMQYLTRLGKESEKKEEVDDAMLNNLVQILKKSDE